MGNRQPAARCGKSNKIDPDTGRPLCKLHNEPMRKDHVKDGVQLYRCSVKAVINAARYVASPKGKATNARFRKTPKGRAVQRRASAKYQASAKGEATRVAWAEANQRKMERYWTEYEITQRNLRIAAKEALLKELAQRLMDGEY